MKKICFACALVLTTLSSYAQDMTLGIKLGGNLANINPDPNNKPKLGIHGGAYWYLKFSEKIGAGLEVLYSQKGTHHVDPNTDVLVHIDYLEVPFLFQYYFVPNFNVHTGLTVAGPVYTLRDYSTGYTDSFTKDIHKTVIGFPLGATYSLDNGLNFTARLDLGLTPIGNDGKRNNAFMLSIGYSFLRDMHISLFQK